MIVIRKKDGVAVFFNCERLDDTGAHGAGWRAPGVTTIDHELINAEIPSVGFPPKAWIWNGSAWQPNPDYAAPPRWPTLEEGKAALIAAVSKLRDEKETAGFPHAGKWFQSDERSVARINSTALTASAALMSGQNPPFPAWTAADNSEMPMDAKGVLALQSALTLHAGALHSHARGLKAQIDAAQKIADLEAINLETGWPS